MLTRLSELNLVKINGRYVMYHGRAIRTLDLARAISRSPTIWCTGGDHQHVDPHFPFSYKPANYEAIQGRPSIQDICLFFVHRIHDRPKVMRLPWP